MSLSDLSKIENFLNMPYCDGWGSLVCHCGGDICACGMDGECCPGCDECKQTDDEIAEDVYDYEVEDQISSIEY